MNIDPTVHDSDDDTLDREAVLIDLDQLKSWIIEENDDVLVVNKPGDVVCHPSKNGPFSSLVGACKEYLQLERLHLVARLDRETSGIVILAKQRKMASMLQSALENRFVEKEYLMFVEGEWTDPISVDQPIARDMNSPVAIRQAVRQDRTAKSAQTQFIPIKSANGFTLVAAKPHTGRKHQIRTHAHWLGYPVVGDKIYGPDDGLYLEFIEHGFTPRLQAALHLRRHALHAAKMTFHVDAVHSSDPMTFSWEAPMQQDMLEFGKKYDLLDNY